MSSGEGRFSNQVAVVTGGANGIGRAVCERLGKEGAVVCIFDIKEDKMQQAADELTAQGISVTIHQVDVASEESVKAALGAVEEAHKRLDIMVNCAGIVGKSFVFACVCVFVCLCLCVCVCVFVFVFVCKMFASPLNSASQNDSNSRSKWHQGGRGGWCSL